jgi:hypothetical protein
MNSTRTQTFRRRITVGWLPVVLLFALGGTAAGCSGATTAPTRTYDPGAASGGGAGMPAGHTMGHAMPTSAEVDAAWAARPAYVQSANARTQEAYAFAIARPDVVDWMPCYCGCGAMDHRNNTDCYMKPRTEGAPVVFDEHASFCEICVDITLVAKSMSAEGKTLLEIRARVDGMYGNAAPGTDTALPPG